MLGKRHLARRTVTATALRSLVTTGPQAVPSRPAAPGGGRGILRRAGGRGRLAPARRLAQANCLIVIDEEVTEVSDGDQVTVIPLLLASA